MLLFNTCDTLSSFSQTTTCPHCKSNDYQLKNNSRFLRFAIVPIIPLTWQYHFQCNECKHSEPVPLTKLPLFELLSLVKYFIGSILIVLFLLYFYTHFHAQAVQQQAIINAPQAYDTYLVKADKFAQEPLRPENLKIAQILEFDDRYITFQISNYRYKHDRGITMAMRTSLLVQRDYFSSKTLTLPRTEVQRMVDEGVIYNVLRPHAYSLYGGFVMFPPRPKPLYEGVKLNEHNQQGINYYKDNLLEDAFKSFLLAAEEGSQWGQLNLAQMYQDGQGTTKDIKKAIYWFQQAAAQGNRKAKIELKDLCRFYTCDL